MCASAYAKKRSLPKFHGPRDNLLNAFGYVMVGLFVVTRILATAWGQYFGWQRDDKAILKRINLLISDTERDPYDGLGKPEKLREGLAGYWSRSITEEHRVVYKVAGEGDLMIVMLKYHY